MCPWLLCGQGCSTVGAQGGGLPSGVGSSAELLWARLPASLAWSPLAATLARGPLHMRKLRGDLRGEVASQR